MDNLAYSLILSLQWSHFKKMFACEWEKITKNYFCLVILQLIHFGNQFSERFMSANYLQSKLIVYHLLFDCQFSKGIWINIHNLCDDNAVYSLPFILRRPVFGRIFRCESSANRIQDNISSNIFICILHGRFATVYGTLVW